MRRSWPWSGGGGQQGLPGEEQRAQVPPVETPAALPLTAVGVRICLLQLPSSWAPPPMAPNAHFLARVGQNCCIFLGSSGATAVVRIAACQWKGHVFPTPPSPLLSPRQENRKHHRASGCWQESLCPSRSSELWGELAAGRWSDVTALRAQVHRWPGRSQAPGCGLSASRLGSANSLR